MDAIGLAKRKTMHATEKYNDQYTTVYLYMLSKNSVYSKLSMKTKMDLCNFLGYNT